MIDPMGKYVVLGANTIVITPAQMSYLHTLRLLPDAVVLQVSSCELNLFDEYTCLCGWALRGVIAQAMHRAIESVTPAGVQTRLYRINAHATVPTLLAEKVGGTFAEWNAIYLGVTRREMPDIELAWALRLDEAVGVTA